MQQKYLERIFHEIIETYNQNYSINSRSSNETQNVTDATPHIQAKTD